MDSGLKAALAQLILLVDVNKETPTYPEWPAAAPLAHAIVHGEYAQVTSHPEVTSEKATQIFTQYPAKPLKDVLAQYAQHLASLVSPLECQLIAVAMLQMYVQNNFTGPESEYSTKSWFPDADEEKLQHDAVLLLEIEGKSAYDLMHEPVLLATALLIFETLTDTAHSLLRYNGQVSIEDVTAECVQCVKSLDVMANPVHALLVWWRSRALQVHMAVLLEPSDILSLLSSVLLGENLVQSLVLDNVDLDKQLHIVFLLESARNSIHAHTETLAQGFLRQAADVSEFQFVLTGAKAKHTKYQKFHTASMVLLAKSADNAKFGTSQTQHTSFALDLDLLLERPQYEQLDNLDMPDQPDKKIRLDFSEFSDTDRVFPIAANSADIPSALLQLDPNVQPNLADTDTLQLLLRYAVLQQTSPSGNALVDEELAAVVTRIVYAESPTVNWAVYGRALWERSVLETLRSRTVERGILQMTALVEEMGINITSKIMPGTTAEPVSSRLQYIHQLPLMAVWSMDAKLAEKYMSLGVLKSATEIYLRLHMDVEAALCYAAVDNEPEACHILEQRLQRTPSDARALSVLGDITENPDLWLQAWDLAHYAKAKASLARYYYNPPPKSGLSKDIGQAILHMRECLSASPLAYENWYFYGCCGLEIHDFDLAAEAFTRCVSLDETNAHAWSNLASALLRLDKPRQAFTALKRALQGSDSKSWRILENYLTVAVQLGEWNDVLYAERELIQMRHADGIVGAQQVDIREVEMLAQLLVESVYPSDGRLTHFQTSCIDLVCVIVPHAASESARCWRIVSRVETWRNRPWAALDALEKAYRAACNNPELTFDAHVWADAVDACVDLVDAYETLGPLPGKHGAGDVVCKDWRYKSRQSVRSLMSKGRASWQDSEPWNTLQIVKERI